LRCTTIASFAVTPFKYYNHNPDCIRTKDCVCRAISTATGLYYEAIGNLLELAAARFECEELCVCCYHKLLEEILCYPRTDCNFEKSVEDLATEYPHNKLLIRIEGHLTTSVLGTVLDIWDCSKELVDCFWIVQ
jgi:hypothetical protein